MFLKGDRHLIEESRLGNVSCGLSPGYSGCVKLLKLEYRESPDVQVAPAVGVLVQTSLAVCSTERFYFDTDIKHKA